MKKFLFILPFFLLFVSCEVEGELTHDRANIVIPPTSKLLYFGDFTATSDINVTGGVKIFLDSNGHKLVLEHFSVSSGPDLKVYLSKTDSPSDYVNLGNLTSATVYAIPSGVDLSAYKYVLIHCQQYDHLFATAQLIQNQEQ